jgi:MFS family permease
MDPMTAASAPGAARPARRSLAPLPRAFLVLWSGQVASTVGSGLTTFAIGVWTYQRTGSVIHYTALITLGTLPAVVLLPLAGALVDRFDRRLAMQIADVGALALSLVLAASAWTGRLDLVTVYVGVAGGAICSALRWPAYSAAVTQLISKERLGHASGMVQAGEAAAQLVCPALAGLILVHGGIGGVLAIDVASFALSLATLSLIRIPATRVDPAARPGRSLALDMAFGWRYVRARPGLLALLLDFAATNYLAGLAVALATPMLLAFAGPDELGTVLSTGGVGFAVATLLLSVLGAPRRRIAGVLAAQLLNGVSIAAAGLSRSIPFIAVSAFSMFFGFGLLNGCSQALWQTKVEPGVQGRVFAVRRMIALSTPPLAYLSAGPLGERVFEPLLARGGPLASSVGRVLGVGPGRGLALLLILAGAAIVALTVAAALHPRIRRIDDELPDAGHAPHAPDASG